MIKLGPVGGTILYNTIMDVHCADLIFYYLPHDHFKYSFEIL